MAVNAEEDRIPMEGSCKNAFSAESPPLPIYTPPLWFLLLRTNPPTLPVRQPFSHPSLKVCFLVNQKPSLSLLFSSLKSSGLTPQFKYQPILLQRWFQ